MSKFFLIAFVITMISIAGFYFYQRSKQYGAPPYMDDQQAQDKPIMGDWSRWVRPEGPLRIGIQAGHWKTNEMPDEQSRLRDRGGGTSNGDVAEWEVNLRIAEETKQILEEKGMVVDLLPATIPPAYWADAFVSIHADGSPSPLVSGYKVAAPRRDLTGRARDLVSFIEDEYKKQIGFAKDPNISRNMTGYYAFAWWRYDHAIHPMTPAAILETGFLTSPSDSKLLINNPEKPAKALADALISFVREIKLP